MASGIPQAKTSPKFLHSNATSHTWIFSAIAELVDNAYDPDVGARQLLIDKQTIQNEVCFTFTDNGAGLSAEKLHKMLSFGYCEKVEINGHKPVGHYGNGFKSGSMRLGKDAIVFTRQRDTMSVGFLSQTFLQAIEAETVIVPIVSYDTKKRRRLPLQQNIKSLEAILKYSLYKSELALLCELDDMQEALQGSVSGTKIVIYNLNRTTTRLELDFESDPSDIINPESQEFDADNIRPVREYVPDYRRSLKEYMSILYLKPRMKIFIRGKKVKTKLVSKSLSRTEKDVYKPSWLDKSVMIVFGFSPNKNDYGIMIYNKNRLIKAFEHVGCQKSFGTEKKGVGVVGVVDLDFLEPIHNKQDFNKTDRFNATINAIGNKLTEYWTTKTNQVVTMGGVTIIEPTSMGLPDWTWVQCDRCLKWRRLIDGSNDDELPDKWFCYLNRDPTHNRCEIEEEPEDEDALLTRATYEKTGNKIIKEEKRQKRITLERREEEVRRQEEMLRRKEQQLSTPLRPAAAPGSRNQPTLRDLELARQELEKAKQREKEQQQLIAKLRSQAPPATPPLSNSRKAPSLNNKSVMNQRKGASAIQLPPPYNPLLFKPPQRPFRLNGPVNANKRGAPAPVGNKPTGPGPASKKPRATPVLQKEDFVVTRNEPSSDSSDSDDSVVVIEDDDVADWRNKRKGKLPVFGRRQTTDDVKPDVSALDRAMAGSTSTPSSSTEEEKPNIATLNKQNTAKNTSQSASSASDKRPPQKATPSQSGSKGQTTLTTNKASSETPKRTPSAAPSAPSQKTSAAVLSQKAQKKNTVVANDSGAEPNHTLPRLPDPVVITPSVSGVALDQSGPSTSGTASKARSNETKNSSQSAGSSAVADKTKKSSENAIKTATSQQAASLPPKDVPKVSSTVQTDPVNNAVDAKKFAAMKKELENSRKTLLSFRTNVIELLKLIVPDVKVKNVVYVDAIVAEMIKANASANDRSSNDESDQGSVPDDKNKSKKPAGEEDEIKSEPEDEVVQKPNDKKSDDNKSKTADGSKNELPVQNEPKPGCSKESNKQTNDKEERSIKSMEVTDTNPIENGLASNLDKPPGSSNDTTTPEKQPCSEIRLNGDVTECHAQNGVASPENKHTSPQVIPRDENMASHGMESSQCKPTGGKSLGSGSEKSAIKEPSKDGAIITLDDDEIKMEED